MPPSAVDGLCVGSVIELDESPDAPVRVQADGRFVGEGQAVSVPGPDGGPRLAVAMRAAKTVAMTFALVAAMLSPTAALAQGAATPQPAAGLEGKKIREGQANRDNQPANSAGFDWVDLLKTLAALAVVVGVIFATRWALRRLNRRLAVGVGSSSALRVLAATPLAGRGELVLVKLGGRLVLVGVSAQGMAALSEITDAAEVAAVEETLERRGAESIRNMFARPERPDAKSPPGEPS